MWPSSILEGDNEEVQEGLAAAEVPHCRTIVVLEASGSHRLSQSGRYRPTTSFPVSVKSTVTTKQKMKSSKKKRKEAAAEVRRGVFRYGRISQMVREKRRERKGMMHASQ